MRATYNYTRMRKTAAAPLREIKIFNYWNWSPTPGHGWQLIWRLIGLNYVILFVVLSLVAIYAALSFSPAFFLRKFVQYLEDDLKRENKEWGWVYVVRLFVTNVIVFLRKSLILLCIYIDF